MAQYLRKYAMAAGQTQVNFCMIHDLSSTQPTFMGILLWKDR